ncbi:hypothetical protein GGTG_13146 [Gaeumannomyces tritici R3-111a-1]|uniref:Uncharacterized protein n=1 Tax=Gaeumannomyces tritici (strain R3-111a-1) TaxID=644352 RepID=J3PI15_GAET3|nr:hypothetical protein GGTG_13146 [Gaeumannomyces tritici R3-111a-1]EJT69527.1 hypothetical protein GGTG_13146 [Gaeumannomyces tritici R3-111a-1]
MPDPNNYTVGWVCAISTEYVAAQYFSMTNTSSPHSLRHMRQRLHPWQDGKNNVVNAVLPNGEYGTNSAAVVARDILRK